jgi:hypothetical protein
MVRVAKFSIGALPHEFSLITNNYDALFRYVEMFEVHSKGKLASPCWESSALP